MRPTIKESRKATADTGIKKYRVGLYVKIFLKVSKYLTVSFEQEKTVPEISICYAMAYGLLRYLP
ncbi:MAG: hypothetical protein HZB61_04580 [Nitrospirae bacterium]|nr:hypothetical protein [Nitrospirota bacterium]